MSEHTMADEQTGRHGRVNGTGANLDPTPSPEVLAALMRGTVMQLEGMRSDMRDLSRQMRIWDQLPFIQLAIAGAVGGGLGGLIAGAVLLVLYR